MLSTRTLQKFLACVFLLKNGTTPDSERNQAIVRCKVGIAYLALLSGLSWLGQADTVASAWGPAIAYASFAYAWVFVVGFGICSAIVRKGAALLLDHLIFAYGFYVGEAGFVLVFWAPIFATIGYGLRFGVRHAMASMVVGGILITGAVLMSPFWQAQPYMAAGIIIGSTALPIYALVLSRRIENSRREAETMAMQFERAAQTDPLTRLLNRRGFSVALEKHLFDPGTSALFYIDLDGFKSVNDAGGHSLGDQILVEVAHVLGSCLRISDVVGRLGGDEFAVLITNLMETEDAYRLSQKIIGAISAMEIPGHSGLRLGASIGVCLLPHPEANDVETVMKAADGLMYQAKNSGKNQYVCSASVVCVPSRAA
ncbi:MAG: Diguanylate cyclase [Pseudomonadota bacterium]|nr:Diguanylate cyclase [Pseudomonadota bacterium]